jgi:CDP-paratose 2-epimerase
MMKLILVTGSSGLIGSEVCRYFHELGYSVAGVDNNQRSVFFGPNGDTRWNQACLERELPNFQHHELDIRDRAGCLKLLAQLKPAAIVHCAAQPSHDRATSMPFDDFDTNAVGTMNLLESARRACPESPFVTMSTNKVYGDGPNNIAMAELESRWDYADPAYVNGIAETFPIDACTHSLFGASKISADIMTQEYGRYFNMPTCVLRGGCLTGPNHCGVELHGFLSYLIKCNIERRVYKVYGYKGKQVRDNIHSLDVARFIHAFIKNPKPAAIYNLGGGKNNACSILEAFSLVEEITGTRQAYVYVPENRVGDHICYYSDLRKMKADYPAWDISVTLRESFKQIVDGWHNRLANEPAPTPAVTASKAYA